MSHLYRTNVLLGILVLLAEFELLHAASERCKLTANLANGTMTPRNNLIHVKCNRDHLHIGNFILSCSPDGRIMGERPLCTRPNCVQPLDPDNGRIEVQSKVKAMVMCREGYVVAGNAYTYCTGHKWDRSLGVCRHKNHSHAHACDFESEDLCGWSNQLDVPTSWHRNTTEGNFHSLQTGPRSDHTQLHINGGYFMLMETASLNHGVHHLVSPIYARELSQRSACCFRFYYFMYGSGVGDLVVSVKPANWLVETMWRKRTGRVFNISGNQGYKWHEQTISIGKMTEDFQIIITAISTGAPYGDIAIDDVSLMTDSDCLNASVHPSTKLPVREDIQLIETMNCSQRCFLRDIKKDILLEKHRMIQSCSCELSCSDRNNCCLDFYATCQSKPTTSVKNATTAPTSTTTTTTTTTTSATIPKTTNTYDNFTNNSKSLQKSDIPYVVSGGVQPTNAHLVWILALFITFFIIILAFVVYLSKCRMHPAEEISSLIEYRKI